MSKQQLCRDCSLDQVGLFLQQSRHRHRSSLHDWPFNISQFNRRTYIHTLAKRWLWQRTPIRPCLLPRPHRSGITPWGLEAGCRQFVVKLKIWLVPLQSSRSTTPAASASSINAIIRRSVPSCPSISPGLPTVAPILSFRTTCRGGIAKLLSGSITETNAVAIPSASRPRAIRLTV